MNVRCESCGWSGKLEDMLEAVHPFDSEEKVHACPNCMELNDSCIGLCDEPGCNQPISCGWPSPGGYRHTCHTHWKKDTDR
jgi:hypothetical protein